MRGPTTGACHRIDSQPGFASPKKRKGNGIDSPFDGREADPPHQRQIPRHLLPQVPAPFFKGGSFSGSRDAGNTRTPAFSSPFEKGGPRGIRSWQDESPAICFAGARPPFSKGAAFPIPAMPETLAPPPFPPPLKKGDGGGFAPGKTNPPSPASAGARAFFKGRGFSGSRDAGNTRTSAFSSPFEKGG